MILLWIHYLLRDFTKNTLCASRFYYGFTIFVVISLGIQHPFREFTMETLFISLKFTLNYENTHLRPEINLIFLSASWFLYEFTICFANSPWIHYFFANCFWIHYLLRDFLLNILFFLEITLNSLFFAKSLWIHYLLRDESIFSSIHFELTICFVILLGIHYLFRESTLNPLFLPNQYERTICFAIPLWIHYHYCGFTMNTLLFSRIEFLFREFRMNSLPVPRLLFQFTICFGN